MYILVDQNNVGRIRQQVAGPLMGASLLQQVDRSLPLRGFAIKYVVRGVERYTLNGMPYAVGAGEYVLANAHCDGRVVIDSASPVMGLCADLPNSMMEGMATAIVRPEDVDVSEGMRYFTSEAFLENRYNSANTATGQRMRAIAHEVEQAPYADHTISSSMYLALAEAVVSDHRNVLPELRKVPSVRLGTRKEIYRRLLRARDMIHADFRDPLTVADLAIASAMSEFHFFRSFRAVFGTTPHHYLRKLRLEHGLHLLKSGRGSVTSVSEACGFADIHTFSKAFKQHFGFSPSAVRGGSSSL